MQLSFVYSLYLLCIFYVDNHALVHFVNEDKASIVPLKQLEKKVGLCTANEYSVVWTDKKKTKKP